MAFLSGNSPIQQRAATVLGRAPILFFRFLEDSAEGGWCVPAKLCLTAPGADDVHDDPCAGYRGQGGKLASRYCLDKFG